MKLGSLKSQASKSESDRNHETPFDGRLAVISRDGKRALMADRIAPTLQNALDRWSEVSRELQKFSRDLEENQNLGTKISAADFLSPLPRAYQWLDGSAFLHHVRLVRKARGADMPENFLTTPLMYQGASDDFLSPTQDIPFLDLSFGLDFESEIGVITDFVPMGTKAKDASQHILLFVLINDISLRGLIPEELAMGFGFLQSKPSTAFGPMAITPDELGAAWKDGRVQLPLNSKLNGDFFGNPEAGVMHFSFFQLIEHAARTRNLRAGTIIGSGTVSNEDETRGSSCIVEKRMIEKIKTGEMKTPFLKPGDRVKIEMLSTDNQSLFGAIDQQVVAYRI